MSAATIQVAFPPAKDPDPKPIVQPENFLTASGGEQVIWSIVTANAAVKGVEIEFGRRRDYFKGGGDSSTVIRKAFPKGEKKIVIVGEVPILTAKDRTAVRFDKYTIRGLDRRGEVIPETEYDPVIVVDEP